MELSPQKFIFIPSKKIIVVCFKVMGMFRKNVNFVYSMDLDFESKRKCFNTKDNLIKFRFFRVDFWLYAF